MGRLTKDPELKSTNNGTSVCTFTVAVDRRFKNASGEREADFIPVVAWRQTAEFVEKYFQKGSRIALVGSIQVRTWDDDSGNRRYITEVIADEVYFADSKQSSGNRNQQAQKAPVSTPPEYFDPDDYDDTALPFDL